MRILRDCRTWCALKKAPQCRQTFWWCRRSRNSLGQVHAPHASRHLARPTFGRSVYARNPESVEEIQAPSRSGETLADWPRRGRSQTWRYLRVETHRLDDNHKVALLVINHPPVNALNERTSTNFTVVQQLEHQDDVDAVVITGARGAFVAGADVKEPLEVGEAGDLESARTPNAAQAAFAALEQLGRPVIAAVNGPAGWR